MDIDVDLHSKKVAFIAGLQSERRLWEPTWRELADYYLPRRYVWLMTQATRAQKLIRNPLIVDGTGTNAARILATGMMNGITSPSRPWFKLRISGFEDDLNSEERIWLDEVQRRMMLIMAESNFYNSLAILYLDLVIFGSAAIIIYEDRDSVIRCYNPALGEFYFGQSARLQVNTFAREFSLRAAQLEEQFGKENLSDRVKQALDLGGARLLEDVSITHLIEPNRRDLPVSKSFPFVETYWETTAPKGKLLSARGFNEFPVIACRWELSANDVYGSSPAMDALGDVKQLQQESIEKGRSLNIMNSPPLVADIQLQNRASAFAPRGVTYISGLTNGMVGAKPVYQIQPPIGEMTMDIRDVQARIRETFNNDLFQMISQLDTVRTATEIDARREEKLVRLGSVLERFESEGLDPSIKRVYSIMDRMGLLPEPPERIADRNIEIQYVSLLTTAQSAVAAIPTERFVQFVGSIAAGYPKAMNIPNWESLIRDYGRDIGVPSKNINPPEEVSEANAAADQAEASQMAMQEATQAAQGAELLSKTDVGGGANALQMLLGG